MQAFAESWSDADDCDHKCVVDAHTATEAFEEVLAVAASEAYGYVCVGAPPLHGSVTALVHFRAFGMLCNMQSMTHQCEIHNLFLWTRFVLRTCCASCALKGQSCMQPEHALESPISREDRDTFLGQESATFG